MKKAHFAFLFISCLIQKVSSQGMVSNISLTYSFVNNINLNRVNDDFSKDKIHSFHNRSLIGLSYDGVFGGELFHLSLATQSPPTDSLSGEMSRFTRFRLGFGHIMNKKKRFQSPIILFVGGHTYKIEPQRFGGWNFGLDWSAQLFLTNKIALKGGVSGAFSYVNTIDRELVADKLWGRNYTAYAGILFSFYRQKTSKR